MGTSGVVLNLVREALALIETSPGDVAGAARKALRVARLAGYPVSAFQIQYDLLDPTVKAQVVTAMRELEEKLGSELGREAVELVNNEYNEERKTTDIDSSDNKFEEITVYATFPIDILESRIDYLARSMRYDTTTVNRVDIAYSRRLQGLQEVLARIRQRIYSFLTGVEQRLEAGEINEGIFATYRIDVDRALSEVAPDVLSQFNSVYKRIAEGDSEALSQGLTSCRRILKATADIVYPARSEEIICGDGKKRILSDDKFVNRLYQFVHEAEAGSAEKEVLRAEIGDVESRLAALNALSSKGAHASIGREEAEQCAIQTYLASGDVLRLHRGRV